MHRDCWFDMKSSVFICSFPDKRVSLEMYPLPAVAGQSLSLRCLVWGTDKIIKSVFYKNDSPFQMVESSHTYKIDATTESEVGQYKCVATYRYVDQTIKTPHEDTSDPQEVSVHGKSVLIASRGFCRPSNAMSVFCFYSHFSESSQSRTL